MTEVPAAVESESAPLVEAVARLGPSFKATLIVVSSLTVLCLLLYVGLGAAIPDPTESQADMIDKLGTAWPSGFTALIGLFAGKATS